MPAPGCLPASQVITVWEEFKPTLCRDSPATFKVCPSSPPWPDVEQSIEREWIMRGSGNSKNKTANLINIILFYGCFKAEIKIRHLPITLPAAARMLGFLWAHQKQRFHPFHCFPVSSEYGCVCVCVCVCVCLSPVLGQTNKQSTSSWHTEQRKEARQQWNLVSWFYIVPACYWLGVIQHCPKVDARKHPKHQNTKKVEEKYRQSPHRYKHNHKSLQRRLRTIHVIWVYSTFIRKILHGIYVWALDHKSRRYILTR